MHLPKTSKTNESLHIYQQESCLQDPQPFHETRKMIRSILSRLVQTLTTWSLILHPIWTSEILSGLIMQLPLSPSFISKWKEALDAQTVMRLVAVAIQVTVFVSLGTMEHTARNILINGTISNFVLLNNWGSICIVSDRTCAPL